ncbi:MAG: leucine-rich repeat protein [Kiritimatiellia bacterium]
MTIGDSVTTIGYGAFYNCTSLTSVTIPDSVTTIGSSAFFNCTSLTSVTIPDSVTTIDDQAFYNCTSLASVTIPDGVTTIGYGAFYNCTSLTSVTIPDNVTAIDDRAFENCTSLASVMIGDSVTTIGGSTLFGCTSLANVMIGRSVTNIVNNMFEYITSMTNITVVAANLNYSSIDGVLFNKEHTTLIFCPRGKTGAYTIPDSVTNIGSSAFHLCTKLTSVTIPDSVTNIIDHAFWCCSSLVSVTIPDSVTNIGKYAFIGCTSLSSLTIPNSVTNIGSSAFWNCGSLASVTIGSGATTIGDSAFCNCTALSSVTLPDSVTNIGSSAFSSCISLTNITVASANPNYSSLEGVLFNKEQTILIQCPGGRIGAYTIPDNVTTIGDSAFCNCTALSSVTLPDSVTTIGDGAFYGCTSLTNITVSSANPNYSSLEGVLFNKEQTTLIFCPRGKTGAYTIPDSVTAIGGSAFSGCTSLTSVAICSGVTNISDYAFSRCTSMASVTIPDSVTTIGDCAFYYCTSLAGVTIPNSVTNIGSSAFWNCTSLADVTIPDSITTIGYDAFSGCTSLTSVTIPGSVTTIGNYAFRNCTSLTSVFFAGNAPTHGYWVFDSCPTTVYHILGTTGWDAYYCDCPTAPWVHEITATSSPGGSIMPAGTITVAHGASTNFMILPDPNFYHIDVLVNGVSVGSVSEYSFVSVTSNQTIHASFATIVPVGISSAVNPSDEHSGDGGSSMKLGGIGLLDDGEMAGIEWSVTGPGFLGFDWKVSSELDYDVLSFHEVGAGATNQISGTGTGWILVSVEVFGEAETAHTFRWEYEKDPIGEYVGDDAGWVDAITWTPKFSLTVEAGTGDGWHTNGSPVAISADASAPYYEFDRWTGDTNGVADTLSASTVLVMPPTNVVLAATYKPILYPLTVLGGNGSGEYPYNSQVVVSAPDIPGKRFYRWTGDVAFVVSAASATTTVTMLGVPISITATYSVPLTVNNGSGSGWHPEGSVVTVKAAPDPLYMEFAAWTGDAAAFLEDASSSTTTLTMPTAASTLTATYRDSIARVSGSYGRTYTQSGIENGISADTAAGAPSGNAAVKLGGSGVVPDNGFTAFETEVYGSGSITFWWKTVSEVNDHLRFLVNGVLVSSISGTKTPWTWVSNRVENAGVTNVLRWEYVKNGSVASSTDAAWVDDIVWIGDVPMPVVAPDMVSTSADGITFKFSFWGERGIPYLVYTKDDLNDPVWRVADATIQETGEENGVFLYEASVAMPAGQPRQFFRISSSPP